MHFCQLLQNDLDTEELHLPQNSLKHVGIKQVVGPKTLQPK